MFGGMRHPDPMPEFTETPPSHEPPAPAPPAPAGAPAYVRPDPVELPAEVDLAEWHAMTHAELLQLGAKCQLRGGFDRNRHHIVLDLMRLHLQRGTKIGAEGILELATDGQNGFLRQPAYNFAPHVDDLFVPAQLIRQFDLRAGNQVAGLIRLPRDREKGIALGIVQRVEGRGPEEAIPAKRFDQLTPLFPKERIILENSVTRSVTPRAIDLIAPLGRGQRGLIIAPPRVGKTIVLKEIARAIRATSPQIRLILLLVDERPEEVTDLKMNVNAEIFSSTFDEPNTRHVQISELVSERAKRLVEFGHDVVILIDSITRLARGYNNLQPNRGRIMSGGVESKALIKPKRFFGAARNVEEGGSLTVLGTTLIDTESRMDEVIFEEFKGTGNMEIHLDRSLVERRLYPAIHILKSGTRRDDLLYHPEEFARITALRRTLAALPPIEAMEVLIRKIRATKTNAELLLTALR